MTRFRGAVLALALVLTGCAAPAPEYPGPTAAALQQQVLATTTAAADGDYDAALSGLDELQAAVGDAFDSGTITQARADSILSAIALVRAELEGMLDGPGNSDKPKPDKPGKPDKD
jgi:hypothetical protein